MSEAVYGRWTFLERVGRLPPRVADPLRLRIGAPGGARGLTSHNRLAAAASIKGREASTCGSRQGERTDGPLRWCGLLMPRTLSSAAVHWEAAPCEPRRMARASARLNLGRPTSGDRCQFIARTSELLDESETDNRRRIRLLEVRTGAVKPLGNSDVLSAIDKRARDRPVWLGPDGLEGDEQREREFHGGADKAALHYSADHYELWALEFPLRKALFVPGGFGENLVSRGLDETGVCIGDRIQIGAALVEVTQPRQPCYKLNIRFEEPTVSALTKQNGRTGWYYRVLQPGRVAASDWIEIVDRPHPDWTVRRVLHLILDEPMDRDSMASLLKLTDLTAGIRAQLSQRLQVGAN